MSPPALPPVNGYASMRQKRSRFRFLPAASHKAPVAVDAAGDEKTKGVARMLAPGVDAARYFDTTVRAKTRKQRGRIGGTSPKAESGEKNESETMTESTGKMLRALHAVHAAYNGILSSAAEAELFNDAALAQTVSSKSSMESTSPVGSRRRSSTEVSRTSFSASRNTTADLPIAYNQLLVNVTRLLQRDPKRLPSLAMKLQSLPDPNPPISLTSSSPVSDNDPSPTANTMGAASSQPPTSFFARWILPRGTVVIPSRRQYPPLTDATFAASTQPPIPSAPSSTSHVTTYVLPPPILAPPRDLVSIRTHWWGYEIFLPRSVATSLLSSMSSVESVTGSLAVIAIGPFAPVRPVLGVVAGYMRMEKDQIRVANGTAGGDGVVLMGIWVAPMIVGARAWMADTTAPSGVPRQAAGVPIKKMAPDHKAVGVVGQSPRKSGFVLLPGISAGV